MTSWIAEHKVEIFVDYKVEQTCLFLRWSAFWFRYYIDDHTMMKRVMSACLKKKCSAEDKEEGRKHLKIAIRIVHLIFYIQDISNNKVCTI